MNKAGLKTKVKALAPEWVKDSYKNHKFKKLYNHEMVKFGKYYGSVTGNNQNQINAKIIFHSHAIEKGLSHIEFRPGFGMNALKALQKYMKDYVDLGYPKEGLAYKNALSCLKSYKNKHLEIDGKLPETFTTLFLDFKNEIENANDQLGGYSILKRDTKRNNRDKNFKELFESRVSVREYSDEAIDISLIMEAIQISTKTPSVCNRQSSRVRVITNPELISQTLNAQGGYTGYDLPPVLLLLTTDTGTFIDHTERNQIYIDGGLFAMSLLTSIEFVGLGACALNAMFGLHTERKIRDILHVPENENLIVFITVGSILEETPYPKSFRYTAEDITKIID